MSDIKSIAVTGKGGTGKTVLATLLIRLLREIAPGKVLAIDADSAMSLPYTLNLKVNRTVGDLRNDVMGPQQLKRRMQSESAGDVIRELVVHGDGFDLVAMGRPEAPGCFCVVNDLLKFGIDTLAEDDYMFTVIDGEAGPEQLNRRVMNNIDLLLVVADMSVRSLQTAAGIVDVAVKNDTFGIKVKHAGLVLNRVRNDQPVQELVDKIGVEVFGYIPEDRMLNQYDRDGLSLLDLPEDSPAFVAVKEILKNILSEQNPR